MTHDFDFKVRSEHYKGVGNRGLIALMIMVLSRTGKFAAGGVTIYAVVQVLWNIIRAKLGL